MGFLEALLAYYSVSFILNLIPILVGINGKLSVDFMKQDVAS